MVNKQRKETLNYLKKNQHKMNLQEILKDVAEFQIATGQIKEHSSIPQLQTVKEAKLHFDLMERIKNLWMRVNPMT
jgi:hypothetical protein